MKPELAYTVKELTKLAGKSYARISFKLNELEKEGKAISRVFENKLRWILTEKGYTEGTVAEWGKWKEPQTSKVHAYPMESQLLPVVKQAFEELHYVVRKSSKKGNRLSPDMILVKDNEKTAVEIKSTRYDYDSSTRYKVATATGQAIFYRYQEGYNKVFIVVTSEIEKLVPINKLFELGISFYLLNKDFKLEIIFPSLGKDLKLSTQQEKEVIVVP